MAIGLLANIFAGQRAIDTDTSPHVAETQLTQTPIFLRESTTFGEFLTNSFSLDNISASIGRLITFPVPLGSFDSLNINASNQTSDKPVDTQRGLKSFVSILTENPETLRISGHISNLLVGAQKFGTDLISIANNIAERSGRPDIFTGQNIRIFNALSNQEFSILTSMYRIFNLWKKRGTILEFMNAPIALRKNLGFGIGFGIDTSALSTKAEALNKYIITDFDLTMDKETTTDVVRYSLNFKLAETYNATDLNGQGKPVANATIGAGETAKVR